MSTKKYKSTRKEGETRGRPTGATRYTKEKLKEIILKAVEEHTLYFINDLVAYLPVSKTIFYKHFPTGSEDHKEIVDLMDNNKIRTKTEIKKKLLKSERATELIALYRLLSTPEEHHKLNQSYIDHTSKGEKVNIPVAKWIDNDEDGE